MKPKTKIVGGTINRGRAQPSKEPHQVLRAGYKPGTDRSPARHQIDTREYSPAFKAGASAISRILKRKG